jgi:hypothetical protein
MFSILFVELLPRHSHTGDKGVGTFGGSEDHTAIMSCTSGNLHLYSYCPTVAEAVLPCPKGMVYVLLLLIHSSFVLDSVLRDLTCVSSQLLPCPKGIVYVLLLLIHSSFVLDSVLRDLTCVSSQLRLRSTLGNLAVCPAPFDHLLVRLITHTQLQIALDFSPDTASATAENLLKTPQTDTLTPTVTSDPPPHTHTRTHTHTRFVVGVSGNIAEKTGDKMKDYNDAALLAKEAARA